MVGYYAERRTRPGIDEQPTAAEGMGSGIGRPHDKIVFIGQHIKEQKDAIIAELDKCLA